MHVCFVDALFFFSELRPVLHQFNLLVSAMVHFISQLQYYITFEVHIHVYTFQLVQFSIHYILYFALLQFLSYHCCQCPAQVMECCWAALVKRVEAAEDLDQVIDAHDQFLEKVTAQCLLDSQSQVLPPLPPPPPLLTHTLTHKYVHTHML